ncbi:MAG: PKD domain-containing protein, partial [Bacteroidia bacterium]
MLKSLRRFFFAALFFLLATKAFTQVSCTPTSGCVPLVGVSFTGVSGATGILWNFGDATSSNINNPTHTYPSSGTYTVTYTATVASSPVTYTLLVKVFPKPVANFSFSLPSSHCAPMTVPFLDLSTGSGTTAITNWQWAFGDGGFSTTQNPSYAYTIPGTFNVTLIVKDANGCDSTITKNAIIPVSAQPTVVIASNPLSLASCTVPFTATFSGSSCVSGAPGGGPLTYNWGFGNTQTSTSQNPSPVTYTAQGAYTVSLTVTDNNSCSKTITTPVTLLQPQVKVHYPDTICLGTRAHFRDSSVANMVTWNFGDASAPYGYNLSLPPTDTLSHLYTTPGNITVTVTATSGLCSQTKTMSIYVEKVTANFTATAPTFTCSKTFPLSFVNTSSVSTGGSMTYTWNFPSGTSNLASPTTTITEGSLNPYTIYNTYKPRIHLTVKSSFGCKDTVSFIYDSIRRITAYFYDDKSEGCVPLTVTFKDSSFSTAPITQYNWNFGDGNTASGPTTTLVVHTYTAVGTYSVIESIINTNGCTDTSFVRWIKVRNPAPLSFSFSPSTVCPNQPVTITTSVNPADSVNHWHIDSDMNMFSGCITNPNPSATVNHTGTFGFTLTAYADGCKSTAVSASSVTVKGPIATGRFFTRCDSNYKIAFHALLQ